MIDQAPQVPPAVVQFAKKNNIDNIQKDQYFYIKKQMFKHKNINEAYFGVSDNIPDFKERSDRIYTHFIYVLVEGDEIRIATPEEMEELNQVIIM